MKRTFWIILAICTAACVFATVPIDDVYHWPYETTTKTTTTTKTKTKTQTKDTKKKPSEQVADTTCQTTIRFIEDEVTLHSDTVVKAVIHRCL